MRKLRALQQGVWYEARARVNNRAPLFRPWKARRPRMNLPALGRGIMYAPHCLRGSFCKEIM
jgi:hypothetical protein